MKKRFNLFTSLLFAIFLCGCQTNGVSSNNTLSSNITIESSGNGETSSESPIDSLTKKLPAHYYDVIDPLSNKQYNWKVPVSSSVALKPTDSYLSYFEGEESYRLLSFFDDISLKYVAEYSKVEDTLRKDLILGIKVYVKYSNVVDENDKIWTYFYITKDGRFGFATADETILLYTDPGIVSYEAFKSRVEEIDDYYHTSDYYKVPFNKLSLSAKQNRNDYIITPNGSGVEVEFHGETTPENIASMNQQGDAAVQEATRIADSSTAYNCHSYSSKRSNSAR